MAPPVLEGLSSKEEDRPQPLRGEWEAPSQVCQASRKEGTVWDVPPPPRSVLAEGEGPGHRHYPGGNALLGPLHELQDAAVEAPRGIQAPDEVPVIPVRDVAIGDEVGDAGQQQADIPPVSCPVLPP